MAASTELTFKKVKVTDKGQISIPVDIQKKIGIAKGDELLLICKGKRIVLEKPGRLLNSWKMSSLTCKRQAKNRSRIFG